LSCYYNVGEVVKKNVNVLRGNSINSYDESIRNTYGEEQKKGGANAPPKEEEVHDCVMSHERFILLDYTADDRRGARDRGFGPNRGIGPFRSEVGQRIACDR
jgi:hypothetical protein